MGLETQKFREVDSPDLIASVENKEVIILIEPQYVDGNVGDWVLFPSLDLLGVQSFTITGCIYVSTTLHDAVADQAKIIIETSNDGVLWNLAWANETQWDLMNNDDEDPQYVLPIAPFTAKLVTFAPVDPITDKYIRAKVLFTGEDSADNYAFVFCYITIPN